MLDKKMVNLQVARLLEQASQEIDIYKRRQVEMVKFEKRAQELQKELAKKRLDLHSSYPTPCIDELQLLYNKLHSLRSDRGFIRASAAGVIIYSIPALNYFAHTFGNSIGVDVPLLSHSIGLTNDSYNLIFSGVCDSVLGILSGVFLYGYLKSRRELQKQYGENILDPSNLKIVENETKKFQDQEK